MSGPRIASKTGAWPGSRRLLRRSDFKQAYEQGMRRASRHFVVFGRRRPDRAAATGLRYGITVTRQLGGAVERNRIRRRTRELLRRQPAALELGACDIVVNPRAAVASANFGVLFTELSDQLAQLGRALGAQRAAER